MSDLLDPLQKRSGSSMTMRGRHSRSDQEARWHGGRAGSAGGSAQTAHRLQLRVTPSGETGVLPHGNTPTRLGRLVHRLRGARRSKVCSRDRTLIMRRPSNAVRS
jgi:hypothetical protein